jgi:hypothetical protein
MADRSADAFCSPESNCSNGQVIVCRGSLLM